MKKVINYFLITLAILIAVVFYFSFDLENILWNTAYRPSISVEKIKENLAKDYTGSNPADDIPLIKNKEEWQKVLNEVDYITVIPKSIIKTNIYSRAKWVNQYKKTSTGSSGRKLAEVKQTSLDISADYTPYYIIELEDGSHILAQMNRGIAKKIQKGESIKLPIGKKTGLTKTAKNMLESICEEWETSTDYVLYTIDNDWAENNADGILIMKLAVSTVLAIALGVILQIVYEKFSINNEGEV